MADRITVRLEQGLMQAFENYHIEVHGKSLTKQDVLRHILIDWLLAKGYPPDSQAKRSETSERGLDVR